jgi:2-polyprenyl-3-methyl-5-hydroxy-6-metoxy-1,4-benzoquinol methylase
MPPDQQIEWTPERVTSFWNFECTFPNRYFSYSNADGLLKRLSKYLVGPVSILDYGCGTGLLLARLAERGHRVAGSDTSEQSLEAVRRRLRKYANFLGALTPDELLAEGMQFDTILAVELVEHLYDDRLDDVLGMLRRLVRPGGHIIVTTPNHERLEDSFLMCPCCKSVFHRWQHVRSWSQTSLTDYLERRGFQVLDAFTTDFSVAQTAHERWQAMSRWRKFRKRLKGRVSNGHARSDQNSHLVVVFRTAPSSVCERAWDDYSTNEHYQKHIQD